MRSRCGIDLPSQIHRKSSLNWAIFKSKVKPERARFVSGYFHCWYYSDHFVFAECRPYHWNIQNTIGRWNQEGNCSGRTKKISRKGTWSRWDQAVNTRSSDQHACGSIYDGKSFRQNPVLFISTKIIKKNGVIGFLSPTPIEYYTISLPSWSKLPNRCHTSEAEHSWTVGP